jgi:hypothetical protein
MPAKRWRLPAAPGIATGQSIRLERRAQAPSEPATPRASHPTKYPGVQALFRALSLPMPVPEYEFDAARRWRFDFAWPGLRIALEIDGGLFDGGAHTRGPAIVAAHAKLNAAATAGWRVFYCTPQSLRHAPAMMESALRPP